RIQRFVAIKQLVGAVHAAGVNIHDIFSGSPFLHESRRDLGATANDERELDLRIGFLKKIPENVLKDRRAVDGEPPFFPGCLHQLFPIALPVRLRRRFRRKDKEKNEATEDGGDFHFFPYTLIEESRLQGFPEQKLEDMLEGLLTVASFWRELRFSFRSAAITLEIFNKSGPCSPWEKCLPCITYFGLLPGPYERFSRRRNPRPLRRCMRSAESQHTVSGHESNRRHEDSNPCSTSNLSEITIEFFYFAITICAQFAIGQN